MSVLVPLLTLLSKMLSPHSLFCNPQVQKALKTVQENSTRVSPLLWPETDANDIRRRRIYFSLLCALFDTSLCFI